VLTVAEPPDPEALAEAKYSKANHAGEATDAGPCMRPSRKPGSSVTARGLLASLRHLALDDTIAVLSPSLVVELLEQRAHLDRRDVAAV
jgi:hypothetical protein